MHLKLTLKKVSDISNHFKLPRSSFIPQDILHFIMYFERVPLITFIGKLLRFPVNCFIQPWLIMISTFMGIITLNIFHIWYFTSPYPPDIHWLANWYQAVWMTSMCSGSLIIQYHICYVTGIKEIKFEGVVFIPLISLSLMSLSSHSNIITVTS